MSTSLPISMAPTWESYHPASVDATKCIGRRTSEAKADRRWSCIVYGAFQCTAPRPVDGSLCADCCLRRTRESKSSTEASNWHGVVTDMASMPNWSHIAGSEWCRSGRPKWLGVEKPKGPYVRRSVSAAAVPVVTVPAVVVPVPPSTEERLVATLEENARLTTEVARLRASLASLVSLATAAVAPPTVLEALD